MSNRPYNNRDNKMRPYTRNTSHNNINMKDAKELTAKAQREFDAMCLMFWKVLHIFRQWLKITSLKLSLIR